MSACFRNPFLTFNVYRAAIFAVSRIRMKKYFAIAALLFSIPALAQKNNDDDVAERKTVVEKPSRDFVMIKITSGFWNDRPDSIKTKGIGRGFAASFMYDFPVKKSNFSFAVGLGINVQNMYFDNQVMNFKDTGSQVLFVSSAAYKRYKYTTTQLELPLELRFFSNNKNRNTGFKASVGANVGLMLAAHNKGVSGSGTGKFIDKVGTRRFTEQWSFAPTMRIGYGNFSVFGSYSLTSVFREGMGPQIMPVTLGICISGL